MLTDALFAAMVRLCPTLPFSDGNLLSKGMVKYSVENKVCVSVLLTFDEVEFVDLGSGELKVLEQQSFALLGLGDLSAHTA